jgi:RNA 2',3'-cyclic 3'-phosphodiesterase
MTLATPAPRDTLRLFIALWPDAAANEWLRACDATIGWPAGAARGGPERWHLTLHFLGAVPRAAMPELLPALQRPFEPFAFELGRVTAWPRGLVVVEPAQAVRALQDLHAELGVAVQRAGQRVDGRDFKPHVTLARRASRARLSAPPTPQRWPVSGYAMVASAGGRYRNLALYPKGVLSRNEGPLPSSSPPAGGGAGHGPALGALSPAADPATAMPQKPPVPTPTPR